MALSCGIVGLPNAGKSTLFKALTGRQVVIESYPFATIDPNRAIVNLPDERLKALASLSGAEKITPAHIEVIDVAGLVKGASRGEGLGNKFLGHLRDVDMLIHVFQAYSDDSFAPAKLEEQIEIINLELILADLEVTARRLEKVEPQLKSKEKEEALRERQLLLSLEEHLHQGLPARDFVGAATAMPYLENLALLTKKKVIYVCNHSDSADPQKCVLKSFEPLFPICAGIEAELADLSAEERPAFMELYGLEDNRPLKLLKECYLALDLITFYTIKGKEARAWAVKKGLSALKGAGQVHSDMEQGFINAEVFSAETLLKNESVARAREKGLARVEGKDYLIEDGDVLFIRFRA